MITGYGGPELVEDPYLLVKTLITMNLIITRATTHYFFNHWIGVLGFIVISRDYLQDSKVYPAESGDSLHNIKALGKKLIMKREGQLS